MAAVSTSLALERLQEALLEPPLGPAQDVLGEEVAGDQEAVDDGGGANLVESGGLLVLGHPIAAPIAQLGGHAAAGLAS
jgi:hypothetical protein